jgi:hypothetical protein
MTEEIRSCLYFKSCGVIEKHNGIKWGQLWRRDKNGNWLCNKHYNVLITNPKRTKEQIKKFNDRHSKKCTKKYHERRINFLGKVFQLSWKIRTGYCSLCPNNIYDKSSEDTHMHHCLYIPIMVWACTEERCISCHNETRKK